MVKRIIIVKKMSDAKSVSNSIKFLIKYLFIILIQRIVEKVYLHYVRTTEKEKRNINLQTRKQEQS